MGPGLVFLLAMGLGAPQAATPPSTVTIDVVVEDAGGRSVESLTPADFLVAEQTVPLIVESARFVRLAGAPLAAPSGPSSNEPAITDTTRLFAIFLDEFHVTAGPDADRVRTALARFVREGLGPRDWMVVLKPLQSLLDIKLTNDREDAARAIESFDPRRGDLAPRTAFEQNFIAGQPARIEAARAQISASSLQALANELSRFPPERKTLIVVSEGLARTPGRWGGELLPTTDSVILAANRAHASIYTIDPALDGAPQSLSAASAANDNANDRRMRDSLSALADRTSGRALPAGDGLGGSLVRTLSDASGYYALTVSAAPARDGRFHPVAVAVRRSGLAVRARAGYWSASAFEEAVLRPPPSAPLPFGAQFPRRMSPLVRPWFGMARGSDGTTHVSFVWEPSPRVPGDRTNRPTPVRVALTVTQLDGTPVFDGIVPPSRTGNDGVGLGHQALASFESPAGRLLVRMAIEDAGARVVDHDVRDLVVGGFPGPVAVGSVAVLRARNAREFQAMAADAAAPPVASREFSRTERLLVRVPVFTADGAPVVSARLVSGAGQAMRALNVSRSPSSPTLYQADVPLAALAAGMYAVEFTVSSSVGEARQDVAFKVTP